jgi:glycosyltransferase involved in cell wall biosynthesis
MGTLVAPLTDELDISLVVTFHGYDISILPQQKKIREGYLDLFKRADCLIGVSDHNADKVKALGAPDEKVCILHNGTDVKNFSYSNPSDRFEGKTVQLLFVGRLVKVKSPVRLVESFAKAKQKVTNDINLHLTIAGNGPEYEAVQSRARELAVNESVTCLGAIPHKEVRRLMQSCHVYVQHSKKTASGAEEGQGITFIEAQASGMPVVATRSGGIPDVVIDGETGYLVKEGDTEAMSERIVRLAQHPETWGKMGHAGRVHVEEQFSLSKQVTKLINIYKSVI